jgi:hypothetical protein
LVPDRAAGSHRTTDHLGDPDILDQLHFCQLRPSPRNTTVIVTFFICSLAIGGSVFMILEMDSPFTGVLRISRWPMENALAHMNP